MIRKDPFNPSTKLTISNFTVDTTYTYEIMQPSTNWVTLCLASLLLFLGLGLVVGQLKGNLEGCEVEGQRIDLVNIPKASCFECICKHGMVQCSKVQCLDSDSCQKLQQVQIDECCPHCKKMAGISTLANLTGNVPNDLSLSKNQSSTYPTYKNGCTKDNVYYKSEIEWRDDNDPCNLFTCTSGVITESIISCHVPCSNPKPPRPGTCCPSCPGKYCRANRRIINEKTSIEDPCIVCNCSNSLLTCTRKACPVLNCGQAKIIHDSDKCCPRCSSTQVIRIGTDGDCWIGTTKYEDGTNFIPDECTSCQCINSTSHCIRKICKELDCPAERRWTPAGSCCPQCRKDYPRLEDTSEKQADNDLWSCLRDGNTYMNGENWNTSSCESCSCSKSEITCSALLCPASKCPAGSILKIPDGQCCPVCEQSPGLCSVYGGSHYRTFDGRLYSFLGSCRYQLVRDCENDNFEVQLKSQVNPGSITTINGLTLRLHESIWLELRDKGRVWVNHHSIHLPYNRSNLEITGKSNDGFEVVWTEGRISWSYPAWIEVEITSRYKGKLCGLCGNFDNRFEDDLTTREGIRVDEPAVFAQSWTVGEESCLDTRKYGAKGCNPVRDRRLCNYIRGAPFEKCLRKINVSSYYERCLEDMCECQHDDKQCHCESFFRYIRDCQRLGIFLPHWRRAVGCSNF